MNPKGSKSMADTINCAYYCTECQCHCTMVWLVRLGKCCLTLQHAKSTNC